MKLFRLVRGEDVTGVSGIGVVAEGVLFADGSAVTRWLAKPYHSTVVWPAPNALEAITAIHGHDGRTVAEWWSYGYNNDFDPSWQSDVSSATEIE